MDRASAIGGDVVHILYGETMGTRWRVCVSAPRTLDLPPLHARIQAELDLVVAQMSTWEPDSDISRYARAAAGSWQALPKPFFDVLRCALEVAGASDGAYDPTVGPLVELWGFGAGGNPPAVPEAAALAAARARVGWRRIALCADSRSALQPGGAALDLSAIAKGYGVDAVVDALRLHGIDAALVDVGGELYGYGRKPDGSPWRIVVEAAPGSDDGGAPCVLALDGTAAATSGIHWHRFGHDGRTYSHTLDPRTGAPVLRAPVAVTVLAGDAMRADAWATALTVMGADAGHEFAAARNLAARFEIDTPMGREVRATPAFPQPLAA